MTKNTTDLRDRKLEGDIHALLMDFRNACLDARSELHQTGEVDTTTNKIIVAQARADDAIKALISNREKLARNTDLTPSEMLLAENERLKQAGDKLYEAASYTGRSFDGTHRLLSAAAHWLDTRGKNSGEYQATLRKELDGEEPTNE